MGILVFTLFTHNMSVRHTVTFTPFIFSLIVLTLLLASQPCNLTLTQTFNQRHEYMRRYTLITLIINLSNLFLFVFSLPHTANSFCVSKLLYTTRLWQFELEKNMQLSRQCMHLCNVWSDSIYGSFFLLFFFVCPSSGLSRLISFPGNFAIATNTFVYLK